MKTIRHLCLLITLLILITTPLVAGSQPIQTQPDLNNPLSEQHPDAQQEQPDVLRIAYLIVTVLSYTSETGLQPCVGANITITGVLRSYTGITNELGVHVFIIHTKLLREKFYIVKASAMINGTQMTQLRFLHIKATDIQTKGFLFVKL